MKARCLMIALAGVYFPTVSMAQVSISTLKSCLEIEDESKERLNCYDQKIAPEPRPVSGAPKAVRDCRFVKEEDDRLRCFNRFVNASPKKKQPTRNRQSQ